MQYLKISLKINLIILLLLSFIHIAYAQNASINIFPVPKEVDIKGFNIVLDKNWKIVLDKRDKRVLFSARYLRDKVFKSYGLLLSQEENKKDKHKSIILITSHDSNQSIS